MSPATATRRTSSISRRSTALSTRSGWGRPRIPGPGANARSIRSRHPSVSSSAASVAGENPVLRHTRTPPSRSAAIASSAPSIGCTEPDATRVPYAASNASFAAPRHRVVAEQGPEHLELGAPHRGPQVREPVREAVGAGTRVDRREGVDERGLHRAVVAHGGASQVEDGQVDGGHRGPARRPASLVSPTPSRMPPPWRTRSPAGNVAPDAPA